ncbi:glycosyltransferase family 4 protein [Rhodovibrionaceae bacterium A322]
MADIVLADHGIEFDGTTLEQRPLGGAESSFIMLAEKFAERGHRVRAYSCCRQPVTHKGVQWLPLHRGLPEAADLYIANRSDLILRAVPKARRCVFWIHNPAGYLKKWRYLWKLAVRRPQIAVLGPDHASTVPSWVPSAGVLEIPYGVNADFAAAAVERDQAPKPRALFVSNPLRSLDWLLTLWESRIHPVMPDAELHVFSGKATYGAVGDSKAAAMKRVLDQAEALAGKGVVLRDPIPKAELLTEYQSSRALLYRGDIGETYCLAVGEAQTLGLPAVVQAIGSTAERVVDGVTGFVAADEVEFASQALRLLQDDALWLSQHKEALARQRSWTWDKVADFYEREILP